MKQGKIYLYDQYVGLLTEDETGFTFAYDSDYLASDGAEAVSLTLPVIQRTLPRYRTVSLLRWVNPRRMAAEHRRKQLENQPAG